LFFLSVLICSQLLVYEAVFYLMAKSFYSAAPILLDWSKFISYPNILAKFIVGIVLVIFSNIFMNRISVKKTTAIDSNKIFAVSLLLLVFTDYVLTQFMAPFGYESFRISAWSFLFIPWPRFVAWIISMTLIYFIFRGTAFISGRLSRADILVVFVTGICLFTVSAFMYNIYTLFIENPGFDMKKLFYIPFGFLLLLYPLYLVYRYSDN